MLPPSPRGTTHGRAHLAAALLAATLAAACGGGLAPGTAAAPTPGPAPAAAPPAASFAYAPGERQLLFESRATVRVASDTAAATDTVVTRIHATLRMAPGAARRALTGTLDSATVSAIGAAAVATPPLAAPIEFHGTVEGGTVRVAIPSDAATDCSSPAGAFLAVARDLLPSLPARLVPGASWSETVTTTSCRGGVVLTTTADHRYVVQDSIALDGRSAVRIARATTYRVTGAGAQAGVPVQVQGDGTGEGELRVDVSAGELLTTTARSTLRLTFSGAGRTQSVVQEGVQTVRALAPRAGS